MTGLYLGAVSFESFELPDHIGFGGAQRLAVHKLIGGARVIDTLGRDDVALTWSGVLSGPEAAARARSLDAMRVEGAAQDLSWDAFYYSVVVARLQFRFCSSWWIPYDISCVVQADLAQSGVVPVVPSIQALASDLALAATFLGPNFSHVIAVASGLDVSNVAGQSQALAVLASAQSQVSEMLQNDQMAIQSDDLGTVVSAAGSMATLTCGNGYLGRSMANLGLLGF